MQNTRMEEDQIDVERSYTAWVELEALALAAEYCLAYAVTDPLYVRYVHFVALCVVLTEEDF